LPLNPFREKREKLASPPSARGDRHLIVDLVRGRPGRRCGWSESGPRPACAKLKRNAAHRRPSRRRRDGAVAELRFSQYRKRNGGPPFEEPPLPASPYRAWPRPSSANRTMANQATAYPACLALPTLAL